MKKFFQNILFLFCILGAFGLGFFWGDIFNDSSSLERFAIEQILSKDEVESNLNKIEYIYNYVSNHHIQASDLDKQQMWDNAIEGLLKDVDGGLTRYFSPSQDTIVQNDIEGVYKGTGVKISKGESGQSYVQNIDKNSDSLKDGVSNGDIIKAVNGIDVSDKPLNEVNNMIDNEDVVVLTLERNGKIVEKEIKNKLVEPTYVSYKDINGINYIKIDLFNEKAVSEFTDYLIKMKSRENLIIDLRQNQGGNLDSYEKIMNLFVEKGTLLYKKESSQGIEEIRASTDEFYKFDKIIVLVDNQTASSSELLASNMRDILGATIIGDKTYGKGSIQTIINLPDGSYVYVSDKEYLTSEGEGIEGVGITPDILEIDYQKQLNKAFDIINN